MSGILNRKPSVDIQRMFSQGEKSLAFEAEIFHPRFFHWSVEELPGFEESSVSGGKLGVGTYFAVNDRNGSGTHRIGEIQATRSHYLYVCEFRGRAFCYDMKHLYTPDERIVASFGVQTVSELIEMNKETGILRNRFDGIIEYIPEAQCGEAVIFEPHRTVNIVRVDKVE